MMTLQLAELAIHIPECIPLFEAYGFDYYQNGNQTLKEACDEKGLAFSRVDEELSKLQKKQDHHLTIEDLDPERLINAINGQHHDHEAETLASIHNAIQDLTATSQTDLPHIAVLCHIDRKFGELKEMLLSHCAREDKYLFPQIRSLLKLRNENTAAFQDAVLKTTHLIRSLELEHRQSVDCLKEIKSLLNGFDVPDGVSQTYKYLMQELKAFEADFHLHIHIENNVLFPRIKDLSDRFKHLHL